MIIDSYDMESEPIVNFEAFYGAKKNLVKICLVIFSNLNESKNYMKFICKVMIVCPH